MEKQFTGVQVEYLLGNSAETLATPACIRTGKSA